MQRSLRVWGAVLLGAFLAAPAGAQDDRRIAQGVTAGGVDLSGLTIDEAAAKLDAALGPQLGKDLVFGAAGRPWRLTMADAKLRFDALRTAKRAAHVVPAPPGADPSQASGGVTAVPLALTHSRLAVRAFVAEVERHVLLPPRDATARFGIRRITLRRSRPGHGLDVVAAEKKIDAALNDPAAPRVLHQRLRHLRPKVTADQLYRTYSTAITIDRTAFTLRLLKRLRVVKTYKIAIGMAGLETPAGQYHVLDKQVDPVWHVPNQPWAGSLAGQTIPGGAPNNALKARWLGLGNGVGIHGTAEDWSIGTRASHGCIRMHVWDVEQLYPRVPLGSPVLIR
jgi:lipoprotein-anchoring transpeptidase ErfK/SrfK